MPSRWSSESPAEQLQKQAALLAILLAFGGLQIVLRHTVLQRTQQQQQQ